MQNTYMTIDWLRENCAKIHYFGLGFIQLKLHNPRFRFHFYVHELPPEISDEDVHNHRYDFVSTIMMGEFTQELFEVIPGDTHLRQWETCQPGTKVEGEPTPCSIRKTSAHTYTQGSDYFLRHDTFHRVAATRCITLLDRSGYIKQYAEVIRPRGGEIICPFRREIPEDRLWESVEDMWREGDINEQIWSDFT